MDLELRDKIMETHGDVKHLVKNFEAHVIDDATNNKEIKGKLEFHQKVIYGGIGILGAIELISKFVK